MFIAFPHGTFPIIVLGHAKDGGEKKYQTHIIHFMLKV